MKDTTPYPDLDRFVTYWRRRQDAQAALSRRLADEARQDAGQIVAMLRRRFAVGRVVLFGSLVSERFGPGSDIDLAIEGLPRGDLFLALAQANQLSRFSVDLKPLEDLESHFRDRVLATGEDL